MLEIEFGKTALFQRHREIQIQPRNAKLQNFGPKNRKLRIQGQGPKNRV